MNYSKFLKNLLKNLQKTTLIEKLFVVFIIIILFLIIFNKFSPIREGFEEEKVFIIKKGKGVYDKFYASVYDDLLYSGIRNDFEFGTIVNRTNPSKKSIILDIGSGTGNLCNKLYSAGFKVTGIDNSQAMIETAQKNYPNIDFRKEDALDSMIFSPDSFTHISSLYLTLYYMQNKKLFFENCNNWLMPGGYLILHLVDEKGFSPCKSTSKLIDYGDLKYKSDYEIFPNDWQNGTTESIFKETFTFKKTGNVRQNEHKLYMASPTTILNIAKSVGLIVLGQFDMSKTGLKNQYLYILQKPN